MGLRKILIASGMSLLIAPSSSFSATSKNFHEYGTPNNESRFCMSAELYQRDFFDTLKEDYSKEFNPETPVDCDRLKRVYNIDINDKPYFVEVILLFSNYKFDRAVFEVSTSYDLKDGNKFFDMCTITMNKEGNVTNIKHLDMINWVGKPREVFSSNGIEDAILKGFQGSNSCIIARIEEVKFGYALEGN